MRLLPQTIILRCPKISAAYALKFLTAAPYPARFFRHRRRFAGYAHQGETPSNAVLNEFPTMRAKRSWGRSTGQRLPPRSAAISHDRSHRRAAYRTGTSTVGNAVLGVPFKAARRYALFRSATHDQTPSQGALSAALPPTKHFLHTKNRKGGRFFDTSKFHRGAEALGGH